MGKRSLRASDAHFRRFSDMHNSSLQVAATAPSLSSLLNVENKHSDPFAPQSLDDPEQSIQLGKRASDSQLLLEGYMEEADVLSQISQTQSKEMASVVTTPLSPGPVQSQRIRRGLTPLPLIGEGKKQKNSIGQRIESLKNKLCPTKTPKTEEVQPP